MHAQSRAKRRLATTNQFGPDHRGSCIPKVILPCSIKALALVLSPLFSVVGSHTEPTPGRDTGRDDVETQIPTPPPPRARASEFELNNDVLAQIDALKCTVISPTKNLLGLKDSEETKPASSLLMHRAKCCTDKAHFVGSSPTSEITNTVRNLLNADLQRLESTDEHDGRI